MKKLIGMETEQWIVGEHVAKKDCPWQSHDTGNWLICKQCGHTWLVRAGDIQKERAQCPNCNPYQTGRGHIDMSLKDQRFGKLVAKEYLKNGYWLCQCDCGNQVPVNKQHLQGRWKIKNGVKVWAATRSCGCENKSLGERTIEEIFKLHQVNFQTQYNIAELSLYMRFDFALFDIQNQLLGLIEYDGEQHFVPIEKWGAEGKLEITQERDERKNQYCKNNNIPLLRIPYTDLRKLNWDYFIQQFPLIQQAVI